MAAPSRTAQLLQPLIPAFRSQSSIPACLETMPKPQPAPVTTRACCLWMSAAFSSQTHSTLQRWRSLQVGSSSPVLRFHWFPEPFIVTKLPMSYTEEKAGLCLSSNEATEEHTNFEQLSFFATT